MADNIKIKDKPNEEKVEVDTQGGPKETKENSDSKITLSVLNDWVQVGMANARKKQWEYFVIDQFLQGNHNIRGNPNDNSIEVIRGSSAVNYPINKMYITFRAVRAYVTRHKPFVEVDTDDSKDQKVIDYARRANALLRRDNKLNEFHRINKDWVYYGVKYGVGYRQVGYNLQKKCCIRWTIDPNDLLIISKTGQFEDAPAVIKCVVRSIGYLSNKFPNQTFAPDNKLAASEYKELALQIEQQDSYGVATTRIQEQTKIVYECWYRLFKKNSKGGLINKVTFVDTGICSEEETPYEEYPFVPYYASIEPNDLHPDGHMKHMVSPQRMFNLLNTQELEYNHIVNRGRYLTEKDSGFSVINTKDGQIIRVNKGKRLAALNPPAINSNLPEQKKDSERYIEDLGGQHDASLGAVPQRVSSGDAIEAIQLGDSNNISDLRDNFEIALAKEATLILKMYSLFNVEGVVVNDVVNEQEVKPVALFGERALESTKQKLPKQYYIEDNGSYCDTATVLTDNRVKVSVNSELGETKAARFAMLLKLLEAGLPLATVLKLIEFPGSADVMQRIAEEAVADMAMEAMKAQMMPNEGSPAEEGFDVAGELDQLNSEVGGAINGQ